MLEKSSIRLAPVGAGGMDPSGAGVAESAESSETGTFWASTAGGAVIATKGHDPVAIAVAIKNIVVWGTVDNSFTVTAVKSMF